MEGEPAVLRPGLERGQQPARPAQPAVRRGGGAAEVDLVDGEPDRHPRRARGIRDGAVAAVRALPGREHLRLVVEPPARPAQALQRRGRLVLGDRGAKCPPGLRPAPTGQRLAPGGSLRLGRPKPGLRHPRIVARAGADDEAAKPRGVSSDTPGMNRMPALMFSKVLVANRGEIAVRVIRALDELGIASVAVYSEADRDAQHVKRADRGLPARPRPGQPVLPRRREAARGHRGVRAPRPFTPATASSPRTPPSRARSRSAGITFIGPPASAIDAMGSKTKARELMKAAGVPIVPGTTEPVESRRGRREDRRGDRLPDRRQGRGRRRRQGLPRRAEAGQAQGRLRGRRARGREVLLATRPSTWSATCRTRATSRSRSSPTSTATSSTSASATAPSSAATRSSSRSPRARWSTTRCASGSARSPWTPPRPSSYHSAGTIEGLFVKQDERRRRVLLPRDEHARAGRALRHRGDDRHRHRARADPDRRRRGAVDRAGGRRSCAAGRSSAASTPRTPARNFVPAPGTVTHYREPSGPGVRVDSGVLSGSEITPLYDPMVAKLIVWDADARARDPAHAARAGGVRGRGRHDADAVPQGDHGLASSGRTRRPAAT